MKKETQVEKDRKIAEFFFASVAYETLSRMPENPTNIEIGPFDSGSEDCVGIDIRWGRDGFKRGIRMIRKIDELVAYAGNTDRRGWHSLIGSLSHMFIELEKVPISEN